MKAKTQSKPFSRLSAAAKRIAIAEDILKQIKAEQYTIRQGTWLDVDPIVPPPEVSQENKAKEVQHALLGGKRTIELETQPATCTCCAVGAACASAIRLFNKHELAGSIEDGFEIYNYEGGVEILKKYFPVAQIDLMEAAFEQRTDGHHDSAGDDALDRAVLFGKKYARSNKRLQAICRNIIKNGGTFKP